MKVRLNRVCLTKFTHLIIYKYKLILEMHPDGLLSYLDREYVIKIIVNR